MANDRPTKWEHKKVILIRVRLSDLPMIEKSPSKKIKFNIFYMLFQPFLICFA